MKRIFARPRNKPRLIATVVILCLAAIGTAVFIDLDEWSPFHRSPADPAARNADEKKAVSDNPELETLYYSDGEGLGISLKKR